MDKDLQSSLAEVITTLKDLVVSAKDFTLEQLPDVVSQFLLFHRVVSLLEFGIALTIMLGGFYVFVKTFQEESKKTQNSFGEGDNYRWGTVTPIFKVLFSGVSGFLAFITILHNFSYWLMVWLAPKVFLIQELARLIK